jgi:hypothetical protein
LFDDIDTEGIEDLPLQLEFSLDDLLLALLLAEALICTFVIAAG